MGRDKAGIAIIGPSGVGKGIVDQVLSVDLRVDPHRVRGNPRDETDIFYLSRDAYDWVLHLLERQRVLPERARLDRSAQGVAVRLAVYDSVVTFYVRDDPQVLFLPSDLSARRRKVEIYAPVLRALLHDLAPVGLGPAGQLLDCTLFIVLLNPWDRTAADVDGGQASDPGSDDGVVLMRIQRERDAVYNPAETDEGRSKRVKRVRDELVAWKLLAKDASSRPDVTFLEMVGWRYTEGSFPPSGEARKQRLRGMLGYLKDAARKQIVNPQRAELFRSCLKGEDEIT